MRIKKTLMFSVFILSGSFLWGLNNYATVQDRSNAKLVLITLDGFRWQELFSGADSLLIDNEDYVSDPSSLKKKFWRDTRHERREALLPFIWNTVAEIGEIHGNRNYGSKVNLTNRMVFSYPGYNEILTGEADDEHITVMTK